MGTSANEKDKENQLEEKSNPVVVHSTENESDAPAQEKPTQQQQERNQGNETIGIP